jgi:hypothetical protein
MDTSIAESVVEHRTFLTNFDKELCCIVSVNGKAVSTATTVLLDKSLYVALVATCSHHCKVYLMLNYSYFSSFFSSHLMWRGYAEVALRASIERALETLPGTEHGIIMHATEMAQSMYSRIGFKEVSDLHLYVHKPSTSM